MDQFTDIQNDLLTEAFNLGMGLAASSLSQMVGEEIKLSVPELLYLAKTEATAHLAEKNMASVSGVKQSFNGPFSGDALLLFPIDKSLALVKLLLKDSVPDDDMTDLQEEALCEVGNIILNAGIASIANMFSQSIDSSLPNFIQGSSNDVMHIGDEDSHVFFMQVDFSISAEDIDGYVIYLLNTQSVRELEKIINNHLDKLGIA